MALLPFVASTMYILFQRKTNHFTENNTKKTCSMLIVGMIKADIPIWTKSTLDNKFSLVHALCIILKGLTRLAV